MRTIALTLATGFLCLLPAANMARAVTLNSGDVAIFNFDFTGQIPPPPYTSMQVEFDLSGVVTSGSSAVFDLFAEPNANGMNAGHVVAAPLPPLGLTFFGLSDAGILDGIFSAKVANTGNAFAITDVVATGANPVVPGPSLQGELVAATPLPAALPLFVTGLGALGLLGWRKKKAAALAA